MKIVVVGADHLGAITARLSDLGVTDGQGRSQNAGDPGGIRQPLVGFDPPATGHRAALAG